MNRNFTGMIGGNKRFKVALQAEAAIVKVHSMHKLAEKAMAKKV